jgi:excisionase family DNA binding protein
MKNTQTLTELARMLDVGAVALMLDVSSRHVYRLADSGKMPRPVKLGGAVRWDRRTIETWIDSGCPGASEGGRR